MSELQSRHPETLTLSEFNKHMGYKGRFVYQLRNEGRLVMTEDGKLVRVAESIRRIAETKDPSRAGVAARHAAERGHELASLPPAESSDDGAGADEGDDGGTGKSGFHFQDSKAKREHYAALREENAYRKEVGELMDADEAIGAFSDAAAKIASVLDAVPSTVGPMLAGLESDEVIRILGEQMDIARTELSAAISKLADEIESRRNGGGGE